MVYFRKARKEDVSAIVKLLADDELGATRERYKENLPDEYFEAFAEIDMQKGNQIIVAVEGSSIIGCLQLTIIPGLARLGMRRAQIEAVRVESPYRSMGIGELLFQEAISIAKSEKCGLVQLTTDKQRGDAHRFYDRLGFIASHEGMKLVF